MKRKVSKSTTANGSVMFLNNVLFPCYALLKFSMDKPRKEMTTKFLQKMLWNTCFVEFSSRANLGLSCKYTPQHKYHQGQQT